MATGWVKMAVQFAPGDPLAPWYSEILAHAGVRCEVLEQWSPSEIQRTHVMLLCGNGVLNTLQLEGLSIWVQNGGSLVVSGGTWGLEKLLGCVPEAGKHHSVGLATAPYPDRLWPEDASRVKFFGANSVLPAGAQTVIECNGRAIATRFRLGLGSVIYVGFHLGQTMAQMVMGRGVEVDAIGAEDGTARLDDGVLRAEDGHNLDFETDREVTNGSSIPFFGEAHADILREIWLRAVFEAVDFTGYCVSMLWTWPNAAPAVAALTLDVHDFEVDRVISLQRMLQMFGCPATWLVSMPGFAADVYRALRAMEHEVGLLFHIEDANGWQEERLRIQLTNLSRLASWPHMASVRVDDGQWKGYQQFYEACEASGARISLNKMGRQPGTSGFLFGTCHPFMPVRKDAHESTVLEIPGHVWQPGLVTPENVGAEIVNRVVARGGCLQVGLYPESIGDGVASMALRRILTSCKERRVTFLRPDDIARFERSRRQIRITQKHVGEVDLIQFASEWEVQGLTVMTSGGAKQGRDRHGDLGAKVVEKYGTTFSAVTIDVPARTLTDVEWAALGEPARRAA